MSEQVSGSTEDEPVHWSEAKYFWGPVCGALALLVILIIVLLELFRVRRKQTAEACGGVGEEVEELIAVEVEAPKEAAPAPKATEEEAAFKKGMKADLGSMEKICKVTEKNETMTLGIGSMGGSLDEYDDLMDDEAIWNEDGSFVVKPKYQAPKKQDLGPVELAPKAGEV